MASTSNLPVDANEYLYASITNVSNFVSVKLSGKNYLLWKAQMLCLMESHDMCGILDDTFAGPKGLSEKIKKQYDSLLKGWIFGSISEDVLVNVLNLSSAKAVWEKLNSIYDPSLVLEQDSGPTKSEEKKEEIDEVAPETNPNGEDSLKIEICKNSVSTKTKTEGLKRPFGSRWRSAHSAILVTNYLSRYRASTNGEKMKKLLEATIAGDWSKAASILLMDRYLMTKEISPDGSTALHTAVGIGHNDFVKNLLHFMNHKDVLVKRNSDGSTALHIAAIVGNTFAADLLVRKYKDLLRVKDHNGDDPLHKAYENMHIDTVGFLLKAVNDDAKSGENSSHLRESVHPDLQPGVKIGVDLLVNAISAKQYNLASEFVHKFPEFASKNDNVLMAIAKTFPHGLGYVETLIYPSFDNISKRIYYAIGRFLKLLFFLPTEVVASFSESTSFSESLLLGLLLTVPCWLVSVFVLIYILILMLCFLFVMFYYVLWKGIKILGGPTKHIEKRKKEWGEAIKILELVCDEIDKVKLTRTGHYTRPILEAASQNAYKVVDEILLRSPVAIQSTDVEGYDIIQLSIIHRSEKVYNLIYEIGERKNRYRTILDSSNNNIVHLVGRLAPQRELRRRRGAALQLQRELQWREEVKKHVFPSYITQENNSKETPDMVFTREHEKLLNEGEQWMKTTAESCSITAALITTIVFAAAITVPGGNDDKGNPLFTNEVAFIVFAVSDAMSLFASSTALLVFLSILTARFAEIDFLVSLPSRMLIGLFSLLLSTIAMMVAFSATLFLVFCHQNLWMIAPTCVLALIPVGFFVALQFPLIVDLLWSTHISVFGYQRKSAVRRFNPNNIRLLFHK